MATYDELARYVADWSNRDQNVLSFSTIRQCIRYAHDECYRTLRIAPMEFTGSGTVTESEAADGYLDTPDDLIEFIQLRKLDDRNNSVGPFVKPYVVAEAKSDLRSFNGDSITLYSDYAYVREGPRIYIYPEIKEGETWELHYYRRFAVPNERWTDTEIRALVINGAFTVNNLVGSFYVPSSEYTLATLQESDSTIREETGEDLNDLWEDELDGTGNLPNFVDATNKFDESLRYIPALKTNWLRDENEKVLLFGALHHAFDYLAEPDMSGTYKGKFEQEIAKLNQEDMLRQYSGGNLNINFYNRLL